MAERESRQDAVDYEYNVENNKSNESTVLHDKFVSGDYIFNRMEVRVVLILAYTFVFCCCFFGNLLVIIVVIVHRRMRTVTNFFLTNLAFADFCVGTFCVYQNLSFYLTTSWTFGDFLCKMYHFVHSLSYTASIAILMVICIERYVAIVYPMWSKQVLTLKRLRIVIILVWFVSAAYCCPRLIMYGTVEVPSANGGLESICILRRSLYNSKTYDVVNFFVCFFIPMIIITILYLVIGIRLWNSGVHIPVRKDMDDIELCRIPNSRRNRTERDSRLLCCRKNFEDQGDHRNGSHIVIAKADGGKMYMETKSSTMDATKITFNNRCCSVPASIHLHGTKEYASLAISETTTMGIIATDNCRKVKFKKTMTTTTTRTTTTSVFRPLQESYQNSAATTILRARRKVIRLLVVVVLTFALCNLPFHGRKLWQHWSPHYDGTSTSSAIFTIITTLILYMNSGINPFLYAFLSDNFRNSMKDVLMCRHHQRIKRQSSSRSTLRITQTSMWQPDPCTGHYSVS